jgi:hypothetical protein
MRCSGAALILSEDNGFDEVGAPVKIDPLEAQEGKAALPLLHRAGGRRRSSAARDP